MRGIRIARTENPARKRGQCQVNAQEANRSLGYGI